MTQTEMIHEMLEHLGRMTKQANDHYARMEAEAERANGRIAKHARVMANSLLTIAVLMGLGAVFVLVSHL
jgi:ABC-type protease/lipase transport system fused ATPase/permease subunit